MTDSSVVEEGCRQLRYVDSKTSHVSSGGPTATLALGTDVSRLPAQGLPAGLNAYFRYGCALRCVTREIETLSAGAR